MAKNNYLAYALTGGATGALDAIDGTALADQDMAFVSVKGGFTYHYILNATSGAAESSPDVISPDANAGTKRWILNDVYGVVLEADFDANTILAATSDNTPVTLTVGEQTLVGRITAGNIAALTPTQIRTLINVEDNADVTDSTNVNAAGAVMESDYNANTVLAATSDDTPVTLTIGEQTIVGRITAGSIAALTPTQIRTMLNVEDGADVTDATNVNAAGAVMEADYNANTILAATSNDTPVVVSVGEQTLVGRITAGAITALTVTQIRTLLNVEDGADVTDATNVAAAGAVMATLADAKGDIIVATADNTFTRLAVGSNTDVLTANSAQAEGVEWAAAGAPGAHDLGGVSHNADTLADLNTKVSDATLVDTASIVLKALFDANTILAATADNTPAAITIGEQTLIGRITAGNIVALTPTQIRTLINVEDGADVTDATNVNTAGAVMEVDFNAHTVLYAVSDDTPVALTVGASTVVGRASAGNIVALTATQLRTIINVEDGADVTDATNVNAAGAVMEVDYNANTILAATSDDTPVTLTVGEQTFVGRITAGNIAALTPAQGRTLFDVPTNGEAILKAFIAAKGDLIGASANDTPLILSVGTNDFVLTADSVEATGMKWATPAAPVAHDLAGAEHNADTLADLNTKISDGTVVDTGDIILKAFMAAKGDLISASADDTPLILSVGTDTYRLVADSGEATGLKWEAIPAASTTVSGEVELATAAETTTGTDATRAVSPDGLAGSIHGTKTAVIKVIADDTALTTGDGKTHFTVPIELNGMDLVTVGAHVYTVSSSGTPTVQLHNLTDTVDMLTTEITIDANEKDSSTALTPAVIDGTNDDVVTGDEIRIDVDVAGTGTAGLEVRLGFRTP